MLIAQQMQIFGAMNRCNPVGRMVFVLLCVIHLVLLLLRPTCQSSAGYLQLPSGLSK